MKLNKTLKEQQFEIQQPIQPNQQTSYGKYQATFAYLEDTQFRGEYIELSQLVIEPQTDCSSMVFYQEQINLNLKSPINQKRQSMLKKVIEIENKKIKIVRLPKIDSQKAIVIEIKNTNQIMIARLPNQLQTTKTSLYNKKGELVGFLSYRIREVNASKGQNEQNDQYQVAEYLQESVSKNKKQNTENGAGQEDNNQQMNSDNQFLPKQNQRQAASPNENQEAPLKKNDDQENSKLQKRTLPKMILPALVKQPQDKQVTEEIKEQIANEPVEIEKKQEERQIREENKLMAKLRQIHNKTLAQKQKMKENQRIKQSNRFKIRTNQPSQEKKSEKDSLSEQGNDQEVKGSKLYKIPVQLKSLQTQQSRNNKKRISVNFPIEFGNRSFLQKHLKQFTPKNIEKNTTNTNNSFIGVATANIEGQNKIYRKPGFITSQKKEREYIRQFTSLKKRQERVNEVQLMKKEISQLKRVQSEDKQAVLAKSNQKFKLAVSRNIVDIKVNQSVKAKKLTKVLNQSYLPKIQQKKEYAQKQIPNPLLDLQLQKKQHKQSKQPKQHHKQKSPSNYQVQKQKTTFMRNEKLDNQDLKSEYSIPISPNEYSFDIIIGNLSVNLYSKAFGKKFVQLSSGRQMYTTDSLHGSHLLWVNRGYLFKKVLSSDSLYVSLKSQVDNYLKILGKAKININQLLLNYKQSFYQSYLHSPTGELLAIIIMGYEIFNHHGNQNTSREQSINIPVTLTPKRTKKLFKGDNKNNKLPIIAPEQNSRKSEQKRNSQYRKYKGGHNIRMERAGRFNTEYTDDEPGPGYYNVISDFDRHTVSRKQK